MHVHVTVFIRTLEGDFGEFGLRFRDQTRVIRLKFQGFLLTEPPYLASPDFTARSALKPPINTTVKLVVKLHIFQSVEVVFFLCLPNNNFLVWISTLH